MKQLRISGHYINFTSTLYVITGEKTMGSKKKNHQSLFQKVIYTDSAVTTRSMIALCTCTQMPIVMYALPKLCFLHTHYSNKPKSYCSL